MQNDDAWEKDDEALSSETIVEFLSSIYSLRKDIEQLFNNNPPQVVRANREKLNQIGYILSTASEDFRLLYHAAFRHSRGLLVTKNKDELDRDDEERL